MKCRPMSHMGHMQQSALQQAALFDHLVGGRKERGRHGKSESLRFGVFRLMTKSNLVG
jgi:hypothetical protein